MKIPPVQLSIQKSEVGTVLDWFGLLGGPRVGPWEWVRSPE